MRKTLKTAKLRPTGTYLERGISLAREAQMFFNRLPLWLQSPEGYCTTSFPCGVLGHAIRAVPTLKYYGLEFLWSCGTVTVAVQVPVRPNGSLD